MHLLKNAPRRILLSTAVILLLAASTTLALGVRPSSAATTSSNAGIVIPLYTYPTDSTWNTVIQVHKAYPTVPMMIIADPTSSGSGASLDPNFASGIKNLQAAGITVLGYVDTVYAGRSVSSAENDVTNWGNWYHPNGIFFDEFGGSNAYYSTLNTFVKALGMTYTMGNPGTTVPTSSYGILDSLVISENPSYPSLSTLSSATSGYSQAGFGYLAYGVSLNTSYEVSSTQYVGWLYITSDSGGNPWNSLPSYFANEVAAIDPPGVTTSTASSTVTSTSKTTSATSSTSAGSGTALLSITTQPSAGYYIQFVVDNTLGATAASGLYTPQTITGTIGHSYSVTVDDYGGYSVTAANLGTFARTSADGGGGTATFTLQGDANLSFTLSTSASTTTTASSTSSTTTTSGKSQLTVSTQRTNGATLKGDWTQLWQNGATIAGGYTPATYTLVNGQAYTIEADGWNNCAFDHWLDNGSTNNMRGISITSNTSLTAVLKCGK
jgi:hypothetical protein